MERNPVVVRQQPAVRESALATNKVLRNTYLLLSATLAFSAVTAGITMLLGLPYPGLIVFLIGFFGLSYAVRKTADSALGILFVFLLTGFMGYILGPIISLYLEAIPNGSAVVMNAFGITALAFVGLSAYVIRGGHRFSFLGSFLFVGLWTAFSVGLVAYAFSLPLLSLVVSGAFVLLSSGLILYQTGEIIHGGETNYIHATVTLYVSIFNIFVSLLNLLGFAGGDD